MYVYDQAHVLAKAIRESEEYSLLKKQKDIMEQDPEMLKMLADYRAKQVEVHKFQLMGQQIPDEVMQPLRQMHELVMANSVMRTFIEAENRLAAVIADIQKIIFEGLDLD